MHELAAVETTDAAWGPLVRLSGEVDLSNARNIDLRLSALIDNSDTGVVIDLDGLSYMDSAGIEVLFGLADRLGRRRQRLAVILGESAPLARIVEMVRLDKVAAICANVDEASRELLGGGERHLTP